MGAEDDLVRGLSVRIERGDDYNGRVQRAGGAHVHAPRVLHEVVEWAPTDERGRTFGAHEVRHRVAVAGILPRWREQARLRIEPAGRWHTGPLIQDGHQSPAGIPSWNAHPLIACGFGYVHTASPDPPADCTTLDATAMVEIALPEAR